MNERMETSVPPGVYAAGDVTGPPHISLPPWHAGKDGPQSMPSSGCPPGSRCPPVFHRRLSCAMNTPLPSTRMQKRTAP
ncbi:hypothetical protein [Methanogenium cariaci]|uniref:hypothetical protein n=1 Tax=Methanogenium cariaci TaxID=2197 RepID=UPI0012F64786|nr:hypothetical protein [Methanogenium cariaci]